MFKNKSTLKIKTIKNTVLPINVPEAKLIGNTRLLLSDNPEQILNETFISERVVLWHDYVQGEGECVHRVYGWHVNSTDRAIKIGVTLENLTSDKINIEALKGIFQVTKSSNLYVTGVGLPLAESCLSSHMQSLKPLESCIENGLGLITQYNVPKGCLLGFTLEFKVCSAKNLHYFLRVIAGKDSKVDLKGVEFQLAENDVIHYRGSWQQADLIARTKLFYVGENTSFSISNGITDNLQLAGNSFDAENATHNPGHYGCVYKLQIPVENQTGAARTIRVALNPRGGEYAGAVKLPIGTFNIPLIGTQEKNFAEVMYYRAPQGRSCIELSFMHAGASTLPIAVYLETI